MRTAETGAVIANGHHGAPRSGATPFPPRSGTPRRRRRARQHAVEPAACAHLSSTGGRCC